MTITEALAEIKTIVKRIEAKRSFIENYQFRTDNLKDPLEKEGGSVKAVNEAQQAIDDLETRLVTLRMGIQKANEATEVSIEGTTKTVADWLVWRREVAPLKERFLNTLASRLNIARQNVQGQKFAPVKGAEERQIDIVVNIDEARLNREKEQIKNILGQLDGQLSLKNATVMLAA